MNPVIVRGILGLVRTEDDHLRPAPISAQILEPFCHSPALLEIEISETAAGHLRGDERVHQAGLFGERHQLVQPMISFGRQRIEDAYRVKPIRIVTVGGHVAIDFQHRLFRCVQTAKTFGQHVLAHPRAE